MNRPEILAPSGSFESVVAACVCGADAIYLGGKGLNARRNAGNFDYEELKKTVTYCHIHGVKVYLTLNIVMFDQEKDELISSAKEAAEIGIDAIIVQDLGVLAILREALPTMMLIASTQMAVHNLEGALEAEKLGCSVVVLARELSHDEIKYIAENLHTAKVEVFAHGALCMCVSGQCYMSSMLGGRSGNRGLCAQPCRLPFSVGGSDHALSLKDLTLVNRIKELSDITIHSLKIEGRMKRPEYVAASVTEMRAALDGKIVDTTRLRSIFSRSGFTTGYFDGKVDKDMFGFRQKEDVVSATDVMQELSRLATLEQPRVALSATFVAKTNKKIKFSVTDEKGNTVVAESDNIPAKAEKAEVTAEKITQSLSKTGGTPYYFSSLDFDLDSGLFIPVSEINNIRRMALDEISKKRSECFSKKFVEPKQEIFHQRVRTSQKLRIRCNKEQFSKELLDLCEYMIMPPEDVYLAGEKGIAEIPRVSFKGYNLPKGIKRAWCGNIGAIHYAKEHNMQVFGGWSLNAVNSDTLEQLSKLGLVDTEISFETELKRIKNLSSPIPIGVLAYGYLPLMIYRNCPVKAALGCERCKRSQHLTDRMGTKFRVRCNSSNTIELFNSVPLYLADKLDEFSCVDFFTLYFTEETKEECLEIAKQYARKTTPNPPKEITRGLYNRVVY